LEAHSVHFKQFKVGTSNCDRIDVQLIAALSTNAEPHARNITVHGTLQYTNTKTKCDVQRTQQQNVHTADEALTSSGAFSSVGAIARPKGDPSTISFFDLKRNFTSNFQFQDQPSVCEAYKFLTFSL
jgi:hypothetical protein